MKKERMAEIALLLLQEEVERDARRCHSHTTVEGLKHHLRRLHERMEARTGLSSEEIEQFVDQVARNILSSRSAAT